MRNIKVAVLQAVLNDSIDRNVAKISELVRQASGLGAQVILPPELFEGPYFCKTQKEEFFSWAKPLDSHPTLQHFQELAKELNVVIPVSLFEKENSCYYNSLVMIDADGKRLGTYRKSHIPDGPGYQEKFYFRPGYTGFSTFMTRYGKIGAAICWDQWFPECARILMLQGAELLLYPTAIGSEPNTPELNTKDLWQRAMIGHSVSNIVPVGAANRIGNEEGQSFYGHSFLLNHYGEKMAELDAQTEGVGLAVFDLEQSAKDRAAFGFFRDRRPELYQQLSIYK